MPSAMEPTQRYSIRSRRRQRIGMQCQILRAHRIDDFANRHGYSIRPVELDVMSASRMKE